MFLDIVMRSHLDIGTTEQSEQRLSYIMNCIDKDYFGIKINKLKIFYLIFYFFSYIIII